MKVTHRIKDVMTHDDSFFFSTGIGINVGVFFSIALMVASAGDLSGGLRSTISVVVLAFGDLSGGLRSTVSVVGLAADIDLGKTIRASIIRWLK